MFTVFLHKHRKIEKFRISQFRFVGLCDELWEASKLTVDSGQWIVSELKMESWKFPIYRTVFQSCRRDAPPGASGRVSGVMWAPSISNKLRSIVGAPVSWLPLTRELREAVRERKACDVHEFTINRTVFRLFLSFRASPTSLIRGRHKFGSPYLRK